MAQVKLGNTYRDRISGFTGVATARYEYLYGCVRVNLEGPTAEGGKPTEHVVDEQRLLNLDGTHPEPSATTGGTRSDPPSRDPQR